VRNARQTPVYRLDLQPLRECNVPDVHGLRRLLKCLLRYYGFQAVRVEELTDGQDPDVRRLQGIVESLAARVASCVESKQRE
jgi:hypothetical protein